MISQMHWCSTGNTENIINPKCHNESFYFMTGQLLSKRHSWNYKSRSVLVLWGRNLVKPSRLKGWRPRNQDWLVWNLCWSQVACWLWGQESCCSTLCSLHSGHFEEAEQFSHWSPWPQDSDTAPCSPQLTQHCLCFLYTTWEGQEENIKSGEERSSQGNNAWEVRPKSH